MPYMTYLTSNVQKVLAELKAELLDKSKPSPLASAEGGPELVDIISKVQLKPRHALDDFFHTDIQLGEPVDAANPSFNQFSKWGVNLAAMPGQCGAAIDYYHHNYSSAAGARTPKILQRIKDLLCRRLQLGCVLHTTSLNSYAPATQQAEARQALVDLGWKPIHEFMNHKTGNLVTIWARNLN